MPTISKGIQLQNKEKIDEIIRLKNEGKTWGQIGLKVKMDRNNVRRSYLKWVANGEI